MVRKPDIRIRPDASRPTIFRARDHGSGRWRLAQMAREGAIERVDRGIYLADPRAVTERHDLALVAARSPRAVVTLVSALQFHGLTTSNPHEVWIALPAGAWSPRFVNPPLRVFHFGPEAFSCGIETHGVEGVTVRVYGVAKTLADCFKFRNRIGLDVAIEALREAWRRRLVTNVDLHRYAVVCRVEKVMRPYLEMLE